MDEYKRNSAGSFWDPGGNGLLLVREVVMVQAFHSTVMEYNR